MALDDILKDIDERKVVNPPVRRNVYVADLNVNVNTDLETPDEINYATRTQVLNKPKQEYMGLKETENPFKLAYNASVDSLKNVLDKVTNFALPEEVRSPIKEASKGAVVAGASLGNLTWGATKIFATEMAMNREMFKAKNELEQSYMRREITQEEYAQKLKELTEKKTEEQNQMRKFIGKDIQADNEAFNQWLQDCGFTPDSKVGKFFFDLGGSITSIGMSVIAFAVTKNPMLAISLISVPEFTSTYTEAIDKGLDPEKAMSAGLTNYSFVASSEFLGGKVLWSTLSKSGFINKAVRKITNLNPRIAISGASGLEEGLQESSQTVGSELINKYYDISQLESREIINNALYDGLQAFLGASLFGGVASNLQFSKIFEKEKTELLKLKDVNGKNIYTPEQAEQIARRTADYVQSKELQEEILNISRTERDNSLSKEARSPKEMKRLIEENLKKMETALPEIKKQMLDIKDKVRENFAGLGLDKEQLDMVAELTQARATLYYNAFGITPLQFYYLNELEITVDENSNILSNGKETGYTVKFNEKRVAEAIDSGKIENIIKSIRTKENLNNFGNYVNKLVAEGKMTEEQRSIVYSQLADRMSEIPTTEQVIDKVREEEVDKLTNNKKETIIASGGINDETYQPTNEFRDLQEYCKNTVDKVAWNERGGLLNEEQRQSVRSILREELRSRRSSGSTSGWTSLDLSFSRNNQKISYNMFKGVDGQTFRDMFEVARAFTTNGELVDLHSVEDYNNFTNYLSDDGLSGFSITPEGDLVSVFNAKSISGKAGFLHAISDIVKREAKTLDCYNSKNQPLAQMYSQIFGFKPVAYMDYNMEYDHDNIAMNHNNPQVYFMANTNKDIELKKFDDWDKAKAYQLQAVSNQEAFNQPAYTGSPVDHDGFSTDYIGTGEGALAHGWGLYSSQLQETAEGYRSRLAVENLTISDKNGRIEGYVESLIERQFTYTELMNLSKEEVQKKVEQIASGLLEKQKERIKIDEGIIKTIDNLLDILKDENQTFSEFYSKIPKEVLGQIMFRNSRDMTATVDRILNVEVVRDIREMKVWDVDGGREVKPDGHYIKTQLEMLKDVYENSLRSDKDNLLRIERVDLKNLKAKVSKGQVFKIDIPENDVLLDEDKTFAKQPKAVQEGIKKAVKELPPKLDEEKLRRVANDPNYAGSGEQSFKTYYGRMAFQKGKGVAISYIKMQNFDSETEKELIDFIENLNLDEISLDRMSEVEKMEGVEIYDYIRKLLGSKKKASLLLNKYGIKGITYNGYTDGRCYVIFDDKAIKILEKFYQMGGPKARTAILDKLEIAQELEYNNVTPENIWKQTGWLHDVDGKWKFEINDKKAKLKTKNLNKSVTKLGDILDHEDLFDAYPELKDMTVHIRKLGRNTYGYFDGKELYMAKKYTEKDKLDEFLSGLLHEIQHYIQKREEFAKGGSPKQFRSKSLPKRLRDIQYKRDVLEWSLYGEVKGLKKGNQGMNQTTQSYIREHIKDLKKLKNKEINKRIKEWEEYNKELADYDKNTKFAKYQRLKGETEARNTQTRQDLTPEERRLSLPYETQDYPNEDLIIKLQDGTEVPYVPRQDNFTGNNLPTVRGELLPRPIDTPIVEQTKSIIRVFRGGDRSTIIHEMAHIFLRDIEVIENQGGVQDEQFRKIKATLDKWLGKKEGQKYTVEQQEKFAQGFETYMATGQAPKEELKSVFDYFKNWMSQIYESVKNMIPITPEVKTMFDEILTLQPTNNTPQTQTEGGNGGGGNIINSQPQNNEDGDIVPITGNAKDLGKIEKKKGIIKSLYDVALDAIEPVSTRLGGIDTRLEYELKMFEARLARRSAIYKDASLDFLKQTDALKKQNNQDYLNYDRALKNGDVYTINRINAKYPKLKPAYEKVRKMLDSIKSDLSVYGIGAIDNYFPRRVMNVDGLVSYLEGTDDWSIIERAMKQKDPDYKSWTEAQRAEFVANWLNGYGQTISNKTTNTKQRKIEIITDEMDRYYWNSNDALLSYIDDISNVLEVSRLLKLGQEEVYELGEVKGGKKSRSRKVSTDVKAELWDNGYIDLQKVLKNINSVLGDHISKLLKDKKITREQELQIKELLNARFNFKNSNVGISALKSLGYIATLGNLTATITQFGDLSYSIDNAGLFGTLKALFGKKEILMQELGIDHPAEDIKDHIKTMDKIISAIFKGTLFTYVDRMGKNTFIATTFMKYRKMIEKDEQKAFDDIARRYGDDFAKDIIHDIKNNIISENIYYFAHCELARVQPISLSEVPKEYLTHSFLRVAYSLKTFWVKQFNRIITDNKRLIQEGIKEKNPEKIKEGALSMARLIILFTILGTGTDVLKDLFSFRDIDFDLTTLDNLLKLIGISRYTVYKMREDGFGNTMGDIIMNIPVLQIFDGFTKELPKVANGKMKVKDLKLFNYLPYIGHPYYWWLGGGRTKQKKKKKRSVL